MEKMCRFFSKSYVLLFLSALLSALPLTFPSLFLLSWISFVPFFVVILRDKDSVKGSILKGAFFGFFYHFFVYFWFLSLYPLTFAGLGKTESMALVLLAWLGISTIHGFFYLVPTLLCNLVARFTKNRPLLLFTAVLGVLLAQCFSGFGDLAFPWVRLSLGQYRAPALIQFASVFGMTGVDFLLLSFSALFTLFLVFPGGKKKVLCLSLAFGLFFTNLAFGMISMSQKSDGEEMSASLVQGNVLVSEKFSGSDFSDLYTDLTLECEDSDLVLWPESAIPVNLSRYPGLLEEFQYLSGLMDTPILLGSFWEKDGVNTNSALLVTKDSVSDPYSKRHLVPFGETMPYEAFFSTVFPSLSNLNLSLNFLNEGEDTAIFQLENGKAGGVICFESLFPALTRESVRDGAELIVLLTNDSWYKDSPAVYQHLAHAVFRSVENGRATLRCAGSGVSALISEKGQIKKELGPLKRGVLTGEVNFSHHTTVYTAVGDIFLPAISLLWGSWLIVSILKERRGVCA